MKLIKTNKFKILFALCAVMLIFTVVFVAYTVLTVNAQWEDENIYINHIEGDETVFDEVGLSGVMTDSRDYYYEFFVNNNTLDAALDISLDDEQALNYHTLSSSQLYSDVKNIYVDYYNLHALSQENIEIVSMTDVTNEYIDMIGDQTDVPDSEKMGYWNVGFTFDIGIPTVNIMGINHNYFWRDFEADFHFDLSEQNHIAYRDVSLYGDDLDKTFFDALFDGYEEVEDGYDYWLNDGLVIDMYPETYGEHVNRYKLSAVVNDEIYITLPTNEYAVGQNGIYRVDTTSQDDYENDNERYNLIKTVALFDINEEGKNNKIASAMVEHDGKLLIFFTQDIGGNEQITVSVFDVHTGEFLSENNIIGEYRLENEIDVFSSEEYIVLTGKTEYDRHFSALALSDNNTVAVVDEFSTKNTGESIGDCLYADEKFYLLKTTEEDYYSFDKINRARIGHGVYNEIEVYTDGEQIYEGEVISDIWQDSRSVNYSSRAIFNLRFTNPIE